MIVTDARIYLTESMGGVLGANVMRDHNVVFDYDNHLVGFAEGMCDYRADALDATPGGDAAEVCWRTLLNITDAPCAYHA